MAEKVFMSVDDQIQLLRSRGLFVSNEEEAKKFLYRNNYYRVSGYSLTLRSHDTFYRNSTFQNIIDIYSFDHELRHILLKYLEIIEVSVKSVYSHVFAKRYGPTAYLDSQYFSDAVKHKEIIAKAEKQKTARLPHEAYLKHFVNELQQNIPLWAYVDLLTISDISFLYAISDPYVQNEVVSSFGILKTNTIALSSTLTNKQVEIMKHYMHSMTIIRNLCAHGSRLYNRLFEQKPSLNKKEKALLLRDSSGQLDNSHLFGFILIMRRLLLPQDFSNLKNEIYSLTQKYPFVDMTHYGFCSQWYTML